MQSWVVAIPVSNYYYLSVWLNIRGDQESIDSNDVHMAKYLTYGGDK